MGHENIGYIAKAGKLFTERQGVKEGDLVFVEHYVTCMQCEWCHKGEYRHCASTDWRHNPNAIRYGYTSCESAPHPWGGFAGVHVSPLERRAPQGSEGRITRASRDSYADGEWHRVGVVRLRGGLQLVGTDPGSRSAGNGTDRRLQAGRCLVHYRDRDRQRRKAS